MNPQPLVSICIANYNGMGIIDECLRSVLAQQGDIAVEILVHDDASTDGGVAYVRENYPEVVLIESDVNVGFCVANNRMVVRAKGEYILLLNNDAALFPDALETLLLEARRQVQPSILTLPQYDATTGKLVDRGCLLDPFYNPVPNLDPARQDVAMVIGACLWIPKALWEELEGFPEWFESIAEDMYLCCRARLAGYAVRALTVSGYRHWQGKSFGGNRVVDQRLSTTFRRRALSERNKSFVMVVCSPALWLGLILPIHLVLLIMEGVVLSLLKGDAKLGCDIYLECLRSLVIDRHQLVRMRKAVSAGSVIGLAAFLQVFYLIPHKLTMLMRHGLPDVNR